MIHKMCLALTDYDPTNCTRQSYLPLHITQSQLFLRSDHYPVEYFP